MDSTLPRLKDSRELILVNQPIAPTFLLRRYRPCEKEPVLPGRRADKPQARPAARGFARYSFPPQPREPVASASPTECRCRSPQAVIRSPPPARPLTPLADAPHNHDITPLISD